MSMHLGRNFADLSLSRPRLQGVEQVEGVEAKIWQVRNVAS